MSTKPYIDFLHIFRFIAALFVIRQHVGISIVPIKILGYDISWLVFGNGNSGGNAVVFFIILSAYLMTKNFNLKKYETNFDGIKRFYIKRLARLYPLYFAIVTLHIFIFMPHVFKNLLQLRDLYLFNYHFQFPFNQVIWILTVLAIFYFFIPFIYIMIKTIVKKTGSSYTQSIIAIFFICLGLYLGSLKLGIEPIRIGFFHITYFVRMLYALILGMGLALLQPYKLTLHSSKKWLAITSSILLYISFTIPANINNYYFYSMLGIFLLCIPVFDYIRIMAPLHKFGKFIYAFLILGGNVSFGMFLVHMMFILQLTRVFRGPLIYRFGDTLGSIFFFFFISALSYITAIFLYNAVEKPGNTFVLKLANYKNKYSPAKE